MGTAPLMARDVDRCAVFLLAFACCRMSCHRAVAALNSSASLRLDGLATLTGVSLGSGFAALGLTSLDVAAGVEERGLPAS